MKMVCVHYQLYNTGMFFLGLLTGAGVAYCLGVIWHNETKIEEQRQRNWGTKPKR